MQRCVEWQSFEYINKRKNKEGKWKKCVKSVKKDRSRPTKKVLLVLVCGPLVPKNLFSVQMGYSF